MHVFHKQGKKGESERGRTGKGKESATHERATWFLLCKVSLPAESLDFCGEDREVWAGEASEGLLEDGKTGERRSYSRSRTHAGC